MIIGPVATPLPRKGLRAPLWLATSTRFAGINRRRAGLVIAAVLLTLTLALAALRAVAMAGDALLYDGVIQGLRAGGDYYALTAQALRAQDLPLQPFPAFRLPAHAVVQAALPRLAAIVLLLLLAIGVAGAWWVRLRPILAPPPARLSAAILLAAGLAAMVQSGGVASNAVWAGLLVALALALRTPGRWVTSAALGLIAMLVLETAALLPIVMAGFAWREGQRHEAAGWALTLLALALVLVAHAWGVSRVVGPLDPTIAWAPVFDVRTAVAATALHVLPPALAVVLVVLAMVGWAAWRGPTAERMFALCGAQLVLAGIIDTIQPGLSLHAPMLLVGLVFVPDAVRDLAAALLDRRRVRVQRIAQ